MISILVTTERLEEVKKAIAREEGLSALLMLTDQPESCPYPDLILEKNTICLSINWRKGIPPLLFADHLPYNDQNLLGAIFLQLGAFDKAMLYLQEQDGLRTALEIALQMQYGNLEAISMAPPVNVSLLSKFERYRQYHNYVLLLHYSGHQQELSLEYVINNYGIALATAPDDEYYAFTTRQLADLYLDMGYLPQAEEAIRQAWQRNLSDMARHALQSSLIQVLLRKLQPPYPKIQLAELTVLLKESLDFYEKTAQPLELGMLSMDAAWVAQLKDNFSEGLACINQAIRLFEEEEVPELQGDAWMRKGTLLYGWAQKGQPFHQKAIDSYQQALKIFSREVAPYVFADIHHHLALIYSEMPSSKEKKAMLYALASKSFQEALAFFTKEHFPYEYGCVCNNYGNALVKFPNSNFQNTTEKAVSYFEEALSVRHADHHPYERATSLLNLLEAYWQLPLDKQDKESKLRRWSKMKALAKEARALLKDHDSVLLEQADAHLQELEKAKNSYA
jgi:tetratricopeptide (TPR) repeat protein